MRNCFWCPTGAAVRLYGACRIYSTKVFVVAPVWCIANGKVARSRARRRSQTPLRSHKRPCEGQSLACMTVFSSQRLGGTVVVVDHLHLLRAH